MWLVLRLEWKLRKLTFEDRSLQMKVLSSESSGRRPVCDLNCIPKVRLYIIFKGCEPTARGELGRAAVLCNCILI